MICINNPDPNNIKMDEKSHKNIFVSYIGYVNPDSACPLYLIINKANGYIEESNRDKYLSQDPTDKGRD